MAKFIWTDQLNIGIDVIDQQHRRIVEYINQLDDARSGGQTREEIAAVLSQLVDYTLSHFAFEESMQEEANYPFFKAHKKVHDLFTQRVAEYQTRFNKGEDITKALSSMLVTWLFNHIKRDDADYAAAIKAHLDKQNNGFMEKKKGLFSKLFSKT